MILLCSLIFFFNQEFCNALWRWLLICNTGGLHWPVSREGTLNHLCVTQRLCPPGTVTRALPLGPSTGLVLFTQCSWIPRGSVSRTSIWENQSDAARSCVIQPLKSHSLTAAQLLAGALKSLHLFKEREHRPPPLRCIKEFLAI